MSKKIIKDLKIEYPKNIYSFTLKDFKKLAKKYNVSLSGCSFTDHIKPYKIPKHLLDDAKIQTYEITAKNLRLLFIKFGFNKSRDVFADMLTNIESYRVYETPVPPKRKNKNSDTNTHQSSPEFKEKHVYTLFYIKPTKEYKYFKIKLAPSTIKGAGIGAYAMECIPKRSYALYRGINKIEKDANFYYSWKIRPFDEDTGCVIDDDEDNIDEYFCYVDGFDVEKSNWTRYANCGLKSKDNNLDSHQKFDKMYYYTTRNIKSGEELFIDYGEDYRENNLGMKGKY